MNVLPPVARRRYPRLVPGTWPDQRMRRLYVCFSVSKIKRRVVKRAFYSSEEDESTEEEFEQHDTSITTPEVRERESTFVLVASAFHAS